MVALLWGCLMPRKSENAARPFIGIDGEGAGVDAFGRQLYWYMSAGKLDANYSDLWKARPLLTEDCIEFILSMPAHAILVGYYFTYDVTMMLRNLPDERLYGRKGIYADQQNYGPGSSPYTWFKGYGIEFRPRQYFRVCRIDRETLKTIPGTSRTVNEVGTFFQKPFVQALTEFKIGDERLIKFIAQQKDRRDLFEDIGPIERRYCRAETVALATLMTKFRDICEQCGKVDLIPSAWRGPGHLASKLHRQFSTPRRGIDGCHSNQPGKLPDLSAQAYFGGRFETTSVGLEFGPLYSYDINSAYPYAMQYLPCPIHTRWRYLRTTDAAPTGSLYVRRVWFQANYEHKNSPLGHLPIRDEHGYLTFPLAGNGTYWSHEIEAAKAAGTEIIATGIGVYAERKCDCEPYKWVRELYEYRRSIGKSELGYPIKLAINSLYGKFAQRYGSAPFRDWVAAGLITSFTRAMLIRAYTGHEYAIVMLATDGIVSREPLDLPIGSGLGQWEMKQHEFMFVVQPGIYWTNSETPKTRGVKRSAIYDLRSEFAGAWHWWCEFEQSETIPFWHVPLTLFVGHRLAFARNKPMLAGCWLPVEKRISFDWSHKRRPFPAGGLVGMAWRTLAKRGHPDAGSYMFDRKKLTEFEEQEREREAAPDFVPQLDE